MRPRSFRHCRAVPWILVLAWFALRLPQLSGAPGPGRELLHDPHFRDGFRLIEPTPGRRIPYGELRPDTSHASPPAWDLDQWSSRYPLAAGTPGFAASGILRWTNSAKGVTLGKPGGEEADLSLRVNSVLEYGGRARTQGEPWVHLLAEQPITNAPPLDQLSNAILQVEARLRSSVRAELPGYSPGLHAAQFQIFLSVQNLRQGSPGYGHYLWFGIPLYDDRSRFPKAHKTQDTGGTGMFIFTPPGETFAAVSAHDRGWIRVDKDLLPLIREGLETAWKAGFLTESRSPGDYRIASMNLGWEVPGSFEVELQLRDLSLRVR
ncbi:MAG TPA: hypothetical protein DCM86_07925 [Verrucomicrobiales bacterium]|nr:hypothetical protein [Verrucomicrobiales bacterium]